MAHATVGTTRPSETRTNSSNRESTRIRRNQPKNIVSIMLNVCFKGSKIAQSRRINWVSVAELVGYRDPPIVICYLN